MVQGRAGNFDSYLLLRKILCLPFYSVPGNQVPILHQRA